MLWQETAIARPQLVEPLPSIAAKRLVAGYTLAEQQSFDAIDVLDPLGDQDLALATKSAGVLFLGCWRFDHRAHPRPAAPILQPRAKPRSRPDRRRGFRSLHSATHGESRSRPTPLPE